jgi:hypothetical protein
MISCSRCVWILVIGSSVVVVCGLAQPAVAASLHLPAMEVITASNTMGQVSHQPQLTTLVALNYLFRRVLLPVIYASLILWIILILQGKDG